MSITGGKSIKNKHSWIPTDISDSVSNLQPTSIFLSPPTPHSGRDGTQSPMGGSMLPPSHAPGLLGKRDSTLLPYFTLSYRKHLCGNVFSSHGQLLLMFSVYFCLQSVLYGSFIRAHSHWVFYVLILFLYFCRSCWPGTLSLSSGGLTLSCHLVCVSIRYCVFNS